MPRKLTKSAPASAEKSSRQMALEIWPIDRLVFYARNPRKNDEQADRMAASIKEFGFKIPVLARSSGEIVDGHLRIKAARKLSITEVPVILCDEWTDAQVKAFRLMVNRSVNWAEWDTDLLGLEIVDLKDLGYPVELTGFDDSELAAFLQQAEICPPGSANEDAVPEVPPVPVTVPGDLWVLDKHRVLCGDCRDFGAIQRLLGAGRANVVVTSPPYAEQREYDQSSGFRPIPPDQYVEWYRDLAANIHAILDEDGSYFLNIKPSCKATDTELYVFDLVLAHAREWGFHFATEFCWERNGVPKSVTQRFKNQFEPIYQFTIGRWKMRPDAVRHFSENVPMAGGPGYGETSLANKHSGSFGAAKKRRNGTKELISDIQGHSKDAGEYIAPGMAYPGNRLPTFAGSHDATGHAAAFPVGLPEFFIKAFSDPGDSVFDPFLGSGSMLMAAEKNGRVGYGTELSPAYCDVIVKRWQSVTGKQAVLESDGRTFDEIAAERVTVAA